MNRNLDMRSLEMKAIRTAFSVAILVGCLMGGANLHAAQDTEAGHIAAALPGSTVTKLPDGTVLILGGMDNDNKVQATVTVRVAGTNSVTVLAAHMAVGRAGHTSTVLPNGTVLIVGGVGRDGKVVSTAEIFDPAAQIFHNLSSGAPAPRAFHTATLLTDGRLLVAGGVSAQGQILQSAELWDFRQKLPTALIPWPTARRNHSARLLANGDVLFLDGQDDRGNTVGAADIFDPNSQAIVSVNDASSLLQEQKGAAEVRASSPQDSATDVPADALISMRFSSPTRMESINPRTVNLKGPEGVIAAQLVAAEGGMLAFITPSAPLLPGTVYQVTLSGAVDARDASVPFAEFTFTTEGEAPVDPNHWLPTSDWRIHAPPSPFEKLALRTAAPGVTALAGRVLKLDGKPLPHVTLSIGERKAVTDENGQFLLLNISSGHQVMVIDGTTAHQKKDVFGLFEVGLEIVPSQTNIVPYTIWMTALDVAHEVTIPSPTLTETVVKNPLLPGMEFHLPPNTVITDRDGKPVTKLTVTPLPIDRTPFPLPATMPVFFTIQPGLSYIRVGSGNPKRGARLFYPNVFQAPAGAIANLWHYDPDTVGWFVYGQGRVEPPGTQIIPFPGVEIYELTGAGVGNTGNAPGTHAPACHLEVPPGAKLAKAVCPKGLAADPVDLSTGLYVYTKTDLVVSDVIPLELKRVYRPNDSVSRAFGIGTTDPYDIFVIFDDSPYSFAELVLPDGGRIHFDCSTGSSNSGPCPSYTHTSSPTGFYGATLQLIGGTVWNLTMKNGTVMRFPSSHLDPTSPFGAGLISMTDRYGNTVTVNRDSSHSERATSVVSPNGRSISFTYDAYNHVIQAANNGGQTVNYAYDSMGRLVAVADANAAACVTANPATWMTVNPATGITVCPTTSYTYDGQHRMLTVTDPKGILYLTNQYDGAGRVTKQTLADGSSYTFAWTLPSGSGGNSSVTPPQGRIYSAGAGGGGGGGGGITLGVQPGYMIRHCASCYAGYMPLVAQVDVTDQRGFIRRVVFGATGYMTDDYYAFGRPEQQHYVYQNFADNLLQQVTDPMGNVSTYNYDNNGNLTSRTWLAGTSSAATTTYSYDSGGFNRLLSVTDPLSHTWSFSYDSNGNMTSASDPLSNQATFTYNSSGQILAASDPLHNTSRYTYNIFGDLAAATDPLENTTHFNFDSVGRMLSVTDTLNEQTSYQYDALNQVLQVTDPRGPQNGVTSFSYDANGNLLSVQDPSQQGTSLMTSYVYDNMDRVITRTDPLQRQESYQYDLAGNLTQYTDRRGKVTSFTYDGLDRTTFVGFGTQPGPTYESQISYKYDGYDRLLAAVDSIAGANVCPDVATGASICRTYNDLTRTYTETTPQGSIVYTADLAGRRQTMTVGGQPAVSYTFDPANRLTQISQATTPAPAVTNFTYDAASRRSSLVLPNGITATYCYDSDSRLTGLLYNNGLAVLCNGSPNLGTLTYNYDPLSRRVQMGGTFAGTGLPQPVASASYDVVNELLQWNGQLFAYDLNGNMTSDGVNTYAWDARNHLAQVNTATFQYDAVGRRTKNAAGTGFLYDFANAVQELSGTTPTYNRITGGVDEFFSRTDSGGNTSTPLTDVLGSTVALVNSSESIITNYSYDPFGNTTASSASTNTFQFTGRENDGNGLYYYRARYYSAQVGRFISEDSLKFRSGDVNFYSYVLNDPTNLIDPFGYWGFGVQIGGGLGGGNGRGSGFTANGSLGAGYFNCTTCAPNDTESIGGFATGVVTNGSYRPVGAPDQQIQPRIVGASIGVNAGGFITNAGRACELSGPFNTYSLDIFGWNFTYAENPDDDKNKHIWTFSTGPSASDGIPIHYTQTTTNTAGGGVPLP
jgi:RHS repeat-associated protein